MRVVAFALLLAGCAAQCPVCQPDIPDDLVIVCFENRLHAYSDAAKQVMPLPVRCGPGRGEHSVHTTE